LRYRRIELPNIRFRNHHVLGKRPVRIHTNDLHVLADMRFPGAALQAFAAGHVHFGGNEVAFLYSCDFISTGHHLTAEFVPRNKWGMYPALRPTVPLVYVDVGSTD